MRLFNKVAIVGVGLIGGSMGLAIKKKKLCNEIIGISRHKNTIDIARRRKAIDSGGSSLNLIKGADLIILATPVVKLIESLPEVFRLAKKGAVILDVASTKGQVLRTANKFVSKDKNFIGCHPLAGLEKRGIVNADADLFVDSLCILSRARILNKDILNKVNSLWKQLGARTILIEANEHDRILSFTSHLPHVLAFSLMHAMPDKHLQFAAAGFKDTTRIASSAPEIWEDIFLTNNKELLKSLKDFQGILSSFSRIIKRKDKKSLYLFLRKAKEKRDSVA